VYDAPFKQADTELTCFVALFEPKRPAVRMVSAA
jgi:hypothetical protein